MAALPGGTNVAITHKFVSGKADGADPTLVQPSKWNQNENMGAGADGQKAVRDSGQTDGASWIDYETASLTNNTAATAAVGDVVALSLAADKTVVLDDTVSSVRKFVVALQTPANAAAGAYGIFGPINGVKAQGSIAAGQYVRKSATTKAVEDAGVAVTSAASPPTGTLGFATTAAAGGFVNVFWFSHTVVVPSASGLPTSYLRGLTLSNNASALKIDAAAGSARDVGDTADMVLASALTAKDLSVAWAVGSSAGLLDTGSIAGNTWYHVFLIKRPDTGVVDVLASTSASAPTMPTNYTLKRRIGSIRSNSGATAVIGFVQQGDEFRWNDSTGATDFNAATGTTANTVTHRVPTGVVVEAFGGLNASAQAGFYISSLDTPDLAPSVVQGTWPAVNGGIGASNLGNPPWRCKTNTSAQTRWRSTVTTTLYIVSHGWIDRRGRDD